MHKYIEIESEIESEEHGRIFEQEQTLLKYLFTQGDICLVIN